MQRNKTNKKEMVFHNSSKVTLGVNTMKFFFFFFHFSFGIRQIFFFVQEKNVNSSVSQTCMSTLFWGDKNTHGNWLLDEL